MATDTPSVAALQAEVATLRAEVAEERRLRVFLMAGLGQRLAGIEEALRAQGVAEAEDPAPPAEAPAQVAPSVAKPNTPAPAATPKDAPAVSPKDKPLAAARATTPPRGASPSEEVAFAKLQQEPLAEPKFKANERVWVMCHLEPLPGQKMPESTWEAATVVMLEDPGFYTVRFDDDEMWDGVKEEEIRNSSPSFAPAASPVHVDPAVAAPAVDAHAPLLGGTALADAPAATSLPSFPTGRPPVYPTTSPPAVQDPAFFSGFVSEFTEGWLANGYARYWMMLRDGELGLQSDPADIKFTRVYKLRDLRFDEAETYAIPGDPEASGRLLILKHAAATLRFVCPSAFDFNAWRFVVKHNLIAARPSNQTDDQYARLAHLSCALRPCVPALVAGQLPEAAYPTIAKAYVVSITNGWMAAGWGRRYMTLHEGWLAHRDAKENTRGFRALPLTDVVLGRVLNNPEYPFVITITTPATGEILSMCVDTSELFVQWSVDLEQSYLAANPEATGSGLQMNLTHDELQEVKLTSSPTKHAQAINGGVM